MIFHGCVSLRVNGPKTKSAKLFFRKQDMLHNLVMWRAIRHQFIFGQEVLPRFQWKDVTDVNGKRFFIAHRIHI